MRATSALSVAIPVLGLLAGCSSSRTVRAPGDAIVAAPTASPDEAAPSAVDPGSGGPMEAAALARQLGLSYETSGIGVRLSNADVLVRAFPGSDRLTIDGRRVAMAEPARAFGSSVWIPASGVAAVRTGVAEAARRRMALVKAPPPVPVVVVAAAPRPPAPVTLPTASSSPRPPTLGEAHWVPPVAERAWKYVVVHHSDDTAGCCAKYDAVHRGKGWENGCGYDFVIGNGTQSGDGEIEVGPRWTRQIQGAHSKTADNRYNETGIGIVLVGDFEHGGRPTARQYEALVRLTRWLMARYGIDAGSVLRHGDCKSTACPGKNFPWARFLGDVGR